MSLDRGLLMALDEIAPLTTAEAVAEAEPGEAKAVMPALLLDPSNRALYSRGILKRRDAPVRGYCGLNGHGKSFMAVRDLLPGLAGGYRVLSTVNILDPESGNPHPNFELFRSWQQLHDVRNTEILLDEITGIMDSRDSGMPKHVRKLIPQMRRANCPVSWTGLDWDNADRRMRQLTWAMVRCLGYAPNRKVLRSDGSKDSVSMWAPNRLFIATTFDAKRMRSSDDSNQITEDREKKRRARVLNREFVWGPGSIAFRAYNTLDSVAQVDNSCTFCGGKITEKICRSNGDHATEPVVR